AHQSAPGGVALDGALRRAAPGGIAVDHAGAGGGVLVVVELHERDMPAAAAPGLHRHAAPAAPRTAHGGHVEPDVAGRQVRMTSPAGPNRFRVVEVRCATVLAAGADVEHVKAGLLGRAAGRAGAKLLDQPRAGPPAPVLLVGGFADGGGLAGDGKELVRV